MNKFLLDSNVIIAFLRGREETIKLIKELERLAGIPASSPVCIAEVQAGVKPREEGKTNAFLEALGIYILEREIANKAGQYTRQHRTKGITLTLPDALIAATCILNDLILVTYNPKHYPLLNLKLYPLK